MKTRANLWMVLLIALLMAAVFLPAAVFAAEETEITVIDSGTCGKEGDNLTWTMTSDGTLTISGEGEMADYSGHIATPWYPYHPWYDSEDKVPSVSIIIEDGVTSIGNNAFDYFYTIKRVQLPKGLEKIGSGTFNHCYNVKEFVIPDSVIKIGERAFESCAFSSISIPNSVTVIEDSVFESCTKLSSVTLSDRITEIGSSAFAMTGLTSIEIPDSVTIIKSAAFVNCSVLTAVQLPKELKKIGEGAFSGCENLEEIEIPESVREIGKRAFFGCAFNSINIPDGITVIRENVFKDCKNLALVTIPNSVIIIDSSAFSGTGLTSIEIPDSVTSIGSSAFQRCVNLTNVVLPEKLEAIYSNTFNNCKNLEKIVIPESLKTIGSEAFSGCVELQEIDIPAGVTEIGVSAFRFCKKLKAVVIPDGVETINNYTFYDCFELSDVTMPSGLTLIGSAAFYECKNLEKIDIPKSVTNIQSSAFYGCEKLQTVELPNDIKNIQSGTFAFCKGLTEIKFPVRLGMIGDTAFKGCTGLTKIVIPKNVRLIEDSAFMNCTGLVSVDIEYANLGSKVFEGCSNLEKVTLDDSIVEICKQTFKDCVKLKTVTLPKNLQYLGSEIFMGCTELESVVFSGDAPLIKEDIWLSSTFYFDDYGIHSLDGYSQKVYYPLDNETWKKANLETYSKNAIWMSKPPMPPSSSITVTPTVFKLEWKAIEGAERYEIFCSDKVDGTYELLGAVSETRFEHELPEVGDICYYKLRSVDAAGNKGDFNHAFGITNPLQQVIVYEISNTASNGKPKLTWKAVDGAVKYEVYRATSKNGTYKKTYTTTGTSYTNTLAVPGTTYYYKVCAVDSAGRKGTFSTVESITCDCARPVVTLAVNASSGKPKLTWNKVDGAAKYEVWNATSKNGTYKRIFTTTGLSCTNTSADVGKTYYYKVRAICGESSAGNSAFSTVKSITCDCARPVVTLAVNASSGKPKLTWNKVEGAAKYEVWNATSKNGTYKRILTTTGLSCTNTSADVGKTYYYKVRAICGESSAGNSAFSTVKSITCDCARPVIAVAIKASSGKPQITWKAVDDASKYEVWSATSKNGTYKRILTTTGLSCTNTSAVPGKTYYYKVKAICAAKSAGNSSFSTVEYITCDCARPVVTIGRSATSGKPKLTWKAVEGAAKYEVWRATSENGTYNKQYTTTKTSYTNTGAKAGRTYYYKVKAICAAKSAGNSAFSSVKSIKSR